MIEIKCECGAHVTGAIVGGDGHSNWCPAAKWTESIGQERSERASSVSAKLEAAEAGARENARSIMETLTKALEAGGYNAAPSTLTGGSSLQIEEDARTELAMRDALARSIVLSQPMTDAAQKLVEEITWEIKDTERSVDTKGPASHFNSDYSYRFETEKTSEEVGVKMNQDKGGVIDTSGLSTANVKDIKEQLEKAKLKRSEVSDYSDLSHGLLALS